MQDAVASIGSGGPVGPVTEDRSAERGQLLSSGPVLDISGAWTSPRQWFAELWAARGLMMTLARKDFFVRYRRASFGVLWAVTLPLVQAIVMAVVFSYVRVIKTHAGVSFPVFVFTGITVWTYFQSTVTVAATSIVDGAAMSSRIYFPRAVMPLAVTRTNLYSLPVSLSLVVIMALIFGVPLDQHLLIIIPATLVLVLLTASLSLTLSALHVYFRDIRYMVQALFTALIYMTPVFIPLPVYPAVARKIVLINPATGVLELFRLAIGGADSQWPFAVAMTLAWTAFLSVTAVYLHCRRDRVFVDLL
jgi:ABC-type polysaccharide/polyol phosphate export permease